ncbi:MAG: beta-ketoacyl-[acyl-carrier-protein] synthase family protein [Moorea sp. SIO4E2]|uniref:beta-ketoacyl-[acyl-carrier-protein] synthase family protein n=1 Tax=Moorena sp. SIO4E2 TaxID=2607826 RepID=UPI0013BD87BC|nr:beta-ketoacyl-[acyl-carrier-protein] synthase family protein [Moorena sp. SIO4E2]NEQ08998.1 beta-ketoacyl-[acyl-carrier-protein] synthase family protein [Moorena sp. SIO4E2]
MEKRRVVITGVGVISSIGNNCDEFWQSLQRGQSGIRLIQAVDVQKLRMNNGAEVQSFNPLDYFPNRQVDLLDRFAQFGVVAAREAVKNASIDWTPDLQERTSIVTGSCVGGQTSEDRGFSELYQQQRKKIHPLTVPRVMANATASHISIDLGIKGPGYTLSTACSSSNHAIGLAYWMVRHGMAEMAIAGGSEAPFSMGHLKAWDALRVISPDTCRPFDQNRSGTILAEGGAMLVLEPLDAALARGAKIYGEIVGFGMSSDAYHLTQPSAQGATLAIESALKDGELQREQIGYINAHGTGTQANDKMEISAICSVFGTHAQKLAISSTKSLHGHALGAAGAIEAVATILALQQGILPPTANFTEPDPQCALDVIPNQSRLVEVEYALSNSFAFGGLNAVLAFRRWTHLRV